MKLRVLIVDDSKVTQSVLTTILAGDSEIEVVGTAENGREAIEKIKSLKPGFATIDIRMPIMDGLEAIENIMAEYAVPILVISDVNDSNAAFTALASGALDVISKSYLKPENAPQLIHKIKLLSKVKVIRHIRNRHFQHKVSVEKTKRFIEYEYGKVVAIACSTGGPKALATILSIIPKDFLFPILIAQHIEDGFVDGLVDWINNISQITTKRGIEGELLKAGTAFVSPTNKHMEVDARGKIRLVAGDDSEIYHPSCNRLLSSVASVFKHNSIGVILTGMGRDGVDGIQQIKEHDGITIAQDEKSSVVFGMPNEAIKSGYIDKILPVEDIGKYLYQLGNCNR